MMNAVLPFSRNIRTIIHMHMQEALLIHQARGTTATRTFGGYIEEAQLAMYGLEIYQEINGQDAVPPVNFIIPSDDERWSSNLWGYPLS